MNDTIPENGWQIGSIHVDTPSKYSDVSDWLIYLYTEFPNEKLYEIIENIILEKPEIINQYVKAAVIALNNLNEMMNFPEELFKI